MELVDYLRVLRRRWLLIVIAVVVCGGTALAVSASRTPLYEASTELVVDGSAGGVLDEIAGRQIAISRSVTYSTYASTRPAVEAALVEAGYPVDGPRPTITAAADGATPFLTIIATDVDRERAAAVVNAYASTFLGVVAQLEGTEDVPDQTLAVLDAAAVPTAPVSPNPVRDASLGLVVGLVLGVAAAFFRQTLDRVYLDADVLEDVTHLPVLGVVPQELAKVSVPTLTHPLSGRAEAYRTVRTNVQFAGPESLLQRIVVTSATPGDGKTAVATNLAVAFARTGQSVVIIDADMRRPRVEAAFGMDPSPRGLSDVLAHGHPLENVVVAVADEGLAVLPAGGAVSNSSELLGSARMSGLLDDLGARFDVVILDCPPVLPVSDSLVLAVKATGVVVVVRLGQTSRDRLKRALSSLRKLDVPVLGLVANGAVAGGDAAYGYGSRYGYDQRPVNGRASRRRRSGPDAAPMSGVAPSPLSRE